MVKNFLQVAVFQLLDYLLRIVANIMDMASLLSPFSLQLSKFFFLAVNAVLELMQKGSNWEGIGIPLQSADFTVGKEATLMA